MQMSILKFVALAVGSAFIAILSVFRGALRTGEDPSDDGPRALISEFLGFWIGSFLLLWSFTVDGKTQQWTLRGIAALAAIASIGLSNYFSNSTEVPESAAKEPTGFKNDVTSIHL